MVKIIITEEQLNKIVNNNNQLINIANKLVSELNDLGIGSYVWHAATTGSVYIRFDDNRMGSVRIADHKGREKLKYKFNIRTDVKTSPEGKWIKDDNKWRFYLSIQHWKNIINVLIKQHEHIQSNPESKYSYTIPKYKQKNNIIYSAIFVDKEKLLNKYPPIYNNVFYDHSTIEFKPMDISNIPVGKRGKLLIIGRLTTDNVDVLLVRNPFSKNEYPHITLSTNEGIKPFQSNEEIKNNLDNIIKLDDGISGIVGYFTGKEIVTNPQQ